MPRLLQSLLGTDITWQEFDQRLWSRLEKSGNAWFDCDDAENSRIRSELVRALNSSVTPAIKASYLMPRIVLDWPLDLDPSVVSWQGRTRNWLLRIGGLKAEIVAGITWQQVLNAPNVGIVTALDISISGRAAIEELGAEGQSPVPTEAHTSFRRGRTSDRTHAADLDAGSLARTVAEVASRLHQAELGSRRELLTRLKQADGHDAEELLDQLQRIERVARLAEELHDKLQGLRTVQDAYDAANQRLASSEIDLEGEGWTI